jgi:hypothetical protein
MLCHFQMLSFKESETTCPARNTSVRTVCKLSKMPVALNHLHLARASRPARQLEVSSTVWRYWLNCAERYLVRCRFELVR